MIRQKSEDYHLDGGPSTGGGGDGLTSPGTKRKNESTFRQLQNDVMGKARSTLSTLGDVWKTSKSTLSGGGGGSGSGGAQSGDQYHDTGGGAGGDGSDYDGRGGGPESAGYEGQFSTPPRSPKSAKDKSSLDFFLWPKGKSKDGSSKGSQKKDKSTKGQSAAQEATYDSSHPSGSKGRGVGQKEPPMSPGTGTIRKQTFGSGQGPGPGPGGRGPPSNHHHQQHYQQQQQPQQQQPHYQHSSRAMKYRYEYGESSGDDFRQRSLDETSEYSRSMEDNMAYVGRAGDDDMGEDGDLRYDDRYYGASGNTSATPRPKSYNEKYSSQYYDYSQGYDHHHRPRSQRSQQQQQRPFDYDDQEEQQQRTELPTSSGNQSNLRKAQNANAPGGSASVNNPSSPAPAQKHILFNEENDILYFKENQRPSKTKSLNEHQSRAEKQQQQQQVGGRGGPSKSASYPKDGGRKMGDSDSAYRQQQQQQQQQLALPSPQPTTSALRKVSRDERANAQQQQQQQQQVRSAPTTPSIVGQNEPNIIRATLKLEKLSSSGAPLGDGSARGGNVGDGGGPGEQQSTSKPTKGIQKQFSTIVNLSRGGGGVSSGSSTLPRGLEYGGAVSKATAGDGGRLPGTILEEDSPQSRQSAAVGVASEGEKRSTGRKICFKDEPVDSGALERLKCQTLPRSAGRSSVRNPRTDGPNTDPNVNEYLDTDMTLPRRGSLDSDLESQAMRIVRTVGQAFEVCHKLTMQDSGDDNLGDDHSELSPCDVSEQDRCSDRISEDDDIKKDPTKSAHDSPRLARPDHLDLATLSHPSVPPSPSAAAAVTSSSSSSSNTMHQHHRSSTSALQSQQDKDAGLDVGSLATQTPLTASREMSSLREQLDQQQQQTRQVLAQLMLVREQLISETNARMDAQARIQQLLQQNRELLEHIASLGGYHEPDRPGLSATAIGIAPQLSSTAKVARWFHTLQWTNQSQSLSRPESGFVSGDSRSERNQKSDVDMVDLLAKDHATSGSIAGPAANGVDLCDEYLLVEGTSNLWSKLSVKKRKKLLGLKLGKVTTF